MKGKKRFKELNLNKMTIALLNPNNLMNIRGGDRINTTGEYSCETHKECTRYEGSTLCP